MAAVENDQFALETRLMVYLRRHCGRIVDLMQFRKDAAYADEILTQAAQSSDEDIRRIVENLRQMLGRNAVETAKSAAPAATESSQAGIRKDARYVVSLR